MKTFPSNFIAEKDTVAGAKARTIFVVRLATGTLYLSDQVFTIASWAGEGSPVTQAWVSDWGQIDWQVSGLLGAPRLSDFSLTIIDDPSDLTRWSALLDDPTNNPYQTACELYLWFADLNAATDPPQTLWQGTFLDRGEAQGELLWRHRFQDQLLQLDTPVGRTLNRTDFPAADPDDVGKFIPIVIGAVKQVPALSIVAGGESLLVSSIGVGLTSLQISDADFFPSTLPFTIRIENEEMSVTAKGSIPEMFIVTRGFNSTEALAHDAGQAVWEVRSDFTYVASDRHMQSLDRVYVEVRDEIWDVTGAVTVFPQGNGSFPNQAVIVAPAKLTIEQAVSIQVVKTGDVQKAGTVTENIGVNDPLDISQGAGTHTNSNTVTVQDLATNAFPLTHEFFTLLGGTPSLTITFPALPSGTFLKQIVTVSTRLIQVGDGDSPNVQWLYQWKIGNSPLTGITAGLNPTFQLQDTSGSLSLVLTAASFGTGIVLFTRNGLVEVISASRSVQVERTPTTSANTIPALAKTTAANKTGTVTDAITVLDTIGVDQSGNSTANRTIGDRVLFSGRGIQDDGVGTYTGQGNRLIARPDHLFKYLLNNDLGLALSLIDVPTEFVDVTADILLLCGHRDPRTWVDLGIKSGETNVITSTTYVAGDNVRVTQPTYHLDGVIDRKDQASRWLTQWAWQSRCYFFMNGGRATLRFRPDSLSSLKTLTHHHVRQSNAVTSLRRGWSGLLDVVNAIEIFGDRNWRQSGGSLDAYQQSSKIADAASITKYGERERPQLWVFDFITDLTLLTTLRDFYLARLKDEHRQLTFDVFLDQAELEFADTMTLQHPLIASGSSIGEIIETNYHPGSGRDSRADRIQLTMREY